MQAGDSEASASGEKANVWWLAPCQQALCTDSTPLRQVYVSNSKCSEREVWAAGAVSSVGRTELGQGIGITLRPGG